MKVFVTRDESCDWVWVWVWKKLSERTGEPFLLKDCDMRVYQRDNKSLENVDAYLAKDFKKKFGVMIKQKTKKCIELPKELLNNEDYKLISDDPNRKK